MCAAEWRRRIVSVRQQPSVSEGRAFSRLASSWKLQQLGCWMRGRPGSHTTAPSVPANHNTPHLASSMDNIHARGAVRHIWDETRIKQKQPHWDKEWLCVLRWFIQKCIFVIGFALTPQCGHTCCMCWVLTLHHEQDVLRERVLVSSEGSCEIIAYLGKINKKTHMDIRCIKS